MPQEYRPRKIDTEWLAKMIDFVADGGLIGYPRSMLTYRINKQSKTMTLIDGNPNNSDHEATVAVAKDIGWKVEVKLE